MAYYNHEHYKNPVEATIFAKENISKWRVVKIEPEIEILRKSKKPKTRVMNVEQMRLHKEAQARKVAKQNTNLKNYARKMDRVKITVGMIFDTMDEMYSGNVRQEFKADAKEARDVIIANAEKLKKVLELVIVDNNGTID